VNKKVLKSSGNWKIFLITEGIYLATFSKEELGLMVIVRSNSVENILEDILRKNSDEKKLSTYFNHPNGNIIEYDLNSPKDQWVIKSVNKISTNRNFSEWDLFDFQ
jgi:hypothetical protein